MGGNALSTVQTKRLPQKDYSVISRDVLNILTDLNITAAATLYYHNKPDFGDLDVLVKSSTIIGNLREIIIKNFNSNEIYHNNSVWSFDFRKFQIDFIVVPDDIWITSNIYYSNNDMSNFMGRIAYSMGFRFGNYGLKLNYYEKGKKFSKIVSRDPQKIFEFLGFDWKVYLMGFNSLTDIFDYIINSKYFNVEIFNYEKLNHQNKTRNKKRKNYELFLNYIKEIALDKKFEFDTQEKYIDMADHFFGTALIKDIAIWKKQFVKESKVHFKFNGNKIMKRFPLKGKELGKSIKRFKSEIANAYFPKTIDHIEIKSKFTNWIYDTDSVVIWNKFAEINNLKILN